jgi:hypothetical protein
MGGMDDHEGGELTRWVGAPGRAAGRSKRKRGLFLDVRPREEASLFREANFACRVIQRSSQLQVSLEGLAGLEIPSPSHGSIRRAVRFCIVYRYSILAKAIEKVSMGVATGSPVVLW